MSADTIEKLIANAIHTAFIKFPEGDGGPNLDFDWIPPEQSSHITKAILLDLDANGISNCEEGLVAGLPTSPPRSPAGLLDRTNDAAGALVLNTGYLLIA